MRREHVSTDDVEWAGRTFGQLTPEEKRRVTRVAAAALQAELQVVLPIVMSEGDRS